MEHTNLERAKALKILDCEYLARDKDLKTSTNNIYAYETLPVFQEDEQWWISMTNDYRLHKDWFDDIAPGELVQIDDYIKRLEEKDGVR